jgi:hypothetical protein
MRPGRFRFSYFYFQFQPTVAAFLPEELQELAVDFVHVSPACAVWSILQNDQAGSLFDQLRGSAAPRAAIGKIRPAWP